MCIQQKIYINLRQEVFYEESDTTELFKFLEV